MKALDILNAIAAAEYLGATRRSHFIDETRGFSSTTGSKTIQLDPLTSSIADACAQEFYKLQGADINTRSLSIAIAMGVVQGLKVVLTEAAKFEEAAIPPPSSPRDPQRY